MKLLDLKKDLKHLYAPVARKVAIVKVPRLPFATIDGAIEKGSEPGKSPLFAEATAALFGMAYTLKFMLKKRKTGAVDYRVMPLEGLWWVENGTFEMATKDNWIYRLMILQPDVITKVVFDEARDQLRKKRGNAPALARLKFVSFEEGLCVQALHVGPYATEPDTVDRMRAFALEHGYRDRVGPKGKHHEIYLGDPRKVEPSKLKTVVRHPIEKI